MQNKKGKKGKKKAKMEPGMAEAQTWASAVIRMISLHSALGGMKRVPGITLERAPLQPGHPHNDFFGAGIDLKSAPLQPSHPHNDLSVLMLAWT
eukprot:1150009-Pelagomonas_calceolata.AAC.4